MKPRMSPSRHFFGDKPSKQEKAKSAFKLNWVPTYNNYRKLRLNNKYWHVSEFDNIFDGATN
jgi:hypothetical protein